MNRTFLLSCLGGSPSHIRRILRLVGSVPTGHPVAGRRRTSTVDELAAPRLLARRHGRVLRSERGGAFCRSRCRVITELLIKDEGSRGGSACGGGFDSALSLQGRILIVGRQLRGTMVHIYTPDGLAWLGSPPQGLPHRCFSGDILRRLMISLNTIGMIPATLNDSAERLESRLWEGDGIIFILRLFGDCV